MPSNKKTSSNSKPRNYDRESGKNRVSSSKKKPIVVPSSESEPDFSDSDVESVLSIPEKDVSARKKKKAAPTKRPSARQDPQIHGEEEDDDDLNAATKGPNDSVAPHMAMLLAATYFTPIMTLSAPEISSYIPDCFNMFLTCYHMMNIVVDNLKLHEVFPGFSSIVFNTFIGYTYYYQILRARAQVPSLQRSREEKRCLQRLESTCHPSGWPIPGPLIGFVKALGYVKPSDTYYSYIVPALPNVSTLQQGTDARSTGTSLQHITSLIGVTRFPIIPAMVEYSSNFANKDTVPYNGKIVPVATPLSATNKFVGLSASSATSSGFQALAFNSGWNSAAEDEGLGKPRLAMSQRFWSRHAIPQIGSGAFLDDIEKFLILDAPRKTEWLRNAAAMVKILDRFFPGGSNLESVGTTATIHSLTKVYIDRATARAGNDNQWFRGMSNWTFKYYGYDDTESGRILTRIGLATMTNAEWTENAKTGYGNRSAERTGPFFEVQTPGSDDATALPRFESYGEMDTPPLARLGEQLVSIYDAKGDIEF